jgi:hypothetical protein
MPITRIRISAQKIKAQTEFTIPAIINNNAKKIRAIPVIVSPFILSTVIVVNWININNIFTIYQLSKVSLQRTKPRNLGRHIFDIYTLNFRHSYSRGWLDYNPYFIARHDVLTSIADCNLCDPSKC